jgi:hypothetical protein
MAVCIASATAKCRSIFCHLHDQPAERIGAACSQRRFEKNMVPRHCPLWGQDDSRVVMVPPAVFGGVAGVEQERSV